MSHAVSFIYLTLDYSAKFSSLLCFTCLSMCRFVKGNIFPKFAHKLFCLVQIEKHSYSCVF